MRFAITSVAEVELTEALEYYRDIDHALAVRFLREYEIVVNRVLRFPESGRLGAGGRYRSALFRGYPYCIAYTVQNNRLTVEAVAHLKRGPQYWQELLKRF